jgi:hypothetical protein
VDEPRIRPQRADRADLRRVAGVLEEQRTALPKRRHLADVVVKRPLPLRDLLARVEKQAPAVSLLEPTREVHRMVVGEDVHVREGDLVLGRRVRPHPYPVDQPVFGQILLDERTEDAGEAERLPRHARKHRGDGRELARCREQVVQMGSAAAHVADDEDGRRHRSGAVQRKCCPCALGDREGQPADAAGERDSEPQEARSRWQAVARDEPQQRRGVGTAQRVEDAMPVRSRHVVRPRSAQLE